MAASRRSPPESTPAAAVRDAAAAVLAGAEVAAHCRLCCALSGGVDSVVLLDTLDHLRTRFGYVLEAAHVHHGLSPAADEWRDFCVRLCQQRGIFLHRFEVEVSRDHSGGLEEAARMARHAALARVECDWLVLGHHRDDQAETVLFRLLRGAGVRGAAAMAAIEAAAVSGKPGRLRPLLEVDRETILAAARAENLDWVDDASNADPRFTRNDLRHRILPVIEARFPAARLTLARAAAHFREAAALLDELAEADALAARLECAEGEQGRVFARKVLLSLSPARLTNLFHRELRLRGLMPPSAARLAEALRQLRTVPGPLVLPLGRCVCHSRKGRVWLMPVQGAKNEDDQ